MNSIVDGVYVINMGKDRDRLLEFDQIMKKFKWEYTRLEAVNGRKLLNPWPDTVCSTERDILVEQMRLKKQYVNNLTWLSKAEIGCLLSHVTLWEKVATDPNLNRIVIFEDDARTHIDGDTVVQHLSEFYQHIRDNNMELQKEPDMLYLGKALDDCLSYTKVIGHVYKSIHPLCLHAYIITKAGAQKMLSMAPFRDAIDIVPIKAIKAGLIDVMVFHPSIFFQDIFGTTSNLRQMKGALNNITECIVAQKYISEDTWLYLIILFIGLAAVIALFLMTHRL